MLKVLEELMVTKDSRGGKDGKVTKVIKDQLVGRVVQEPTVIKDSKDSKAGRVGRVGRVGKDLLVHRVL